MTGEPGSAVPATTTSWLNALLAAVAFLGQMPGMHVHGIEAKGRPLVDDRPAAAGEREPGH